MLQPKLSQLAETLIGSEIVRLGNQVRERIRMGETIYNFTIGDFDPAIFPIPAALESEIIDAYQKKYTSYPAAEGELELRKSVSNFIKQWERLDYDVNEIQVASGGRPLMYSLFQTIVDRGDKVIYAVPSWNNNHYTHLTGGEHCVIEVTPEENFMPAAAAIEPHIKDAVLICLCSPQNPTGTTLQKSELEKICHLIIAENERRGEQDKKLYLMYDQMYWTLTYGETVHSNPVSLVPAMKEYTVFIDGISKSFCATGVRVGWSLGPAVIIAKMKAILSHLGAWAPMAEQKATAIFLNKTDEIMQFITGYKSELEYRLVQIFQGIKQLQADGFNVDCISPQAAMYLTVKIDLAGKTSAIGTLLTDQAAVTQYLLEEAKLALVPFNCFGDSHASPWYRLSVGTCKKEDIQPMLQQLRAALKQLR
ncbi:MAG: pyridoxal phosphate-dependent aminotransferase [Bacteroidota bacterium]